MRNKAERCWVAYSTVGSHERACELAHRLVDEQPLAGKGRAGQGMDVDDEVFGIAMRRIEESFAVFARL